MKKSFYLAAGLLILASGFQFGKAQDKAATRTLKVNVKYTGSGTVDDKHKIQVFLFDSLEQLRFPTSAVRRFILPPFTTPKGNMMAHPARLRPAPPLACTPKSPPNPRP